MIDKDFEPKKKYYKDNNMFPLETRSERQGQRDFHRRDRYTHRRRFMRTDFSNEEKAEILSRVMIIGAEAAAHEAGTSKEIVMQWLNALDKSISDESASVWKDDYTHDTSLSEHDSKEKSPKEAETIALDPNNQTYNNDEELTSKPPVVTSLYKDIQTQKVKISQLVPFDKHPFIVPDKDSSDMRKLISSIEKEGLLTLPIVRKLDRNMNVSDTASEEKKLYQIVCGHRRIEACKTLGYEEIPVRVVEFADDDEATLVMISSNIQREKIDFSERVRACSLMYETKKHQGKSGKAIGIEEKSTREYVGKLWNASSTTVERFVRLATLSDGLLDLISRKKLTAIAGMEIAGMSKEMQGRIERVIYENKDLRPSLQQAKAIRAKGNMTEEELIAFIQEDEKPATKKLAVKFSADEIKKILPDEENPTEERIKAYIFERLGIKNLSSQLT